MKKIVLLMLIAAFSIAGEIKVAAAANTTYAFDELLAKFKELRPDIKVDVSLGASGAFATQIRNGAPFDIFMAADMAFAQGLYEDGNAVLPAVIYAKGKLAIFTIRNFDLSKGLELLKDSNIKTISIANPNVAPYGAATVQAFKNAEIYDEIEGKIVQAKSIGEALSQAMSASDVGFVAASAIYSPKMSKYKEGQNYAFVDSSLYSPIEQGIVILKKAKDSADAKAFYDFILSDDAKSIFKKFGYEF